MEKTHKLLAEIASFMKKENINMEEGIAACEIAKGLMLKGYLETY